MNVIDLFSGIGGISRGLEMVRDENDKQVFFTKLFCEVDPYCQKVLKKHWPDVPIVDDIRELNDETLADTESGGCERRGSHEMGNRGEMADRVERGGKYRGNEFSENRITPIHADVITGGYPCQPFSVAGKQRGEDDERHLWPEMLRVIQTVRPRWVIAENVYGHIKLGYDTVASQLEDNNFTVWTFVVPACAVDAPHRRDRLWIVGYSEHNGLLAEQEFRGDETTSNKRRKEEQETTGESQGADRPRNGEGIYRGEVGSESCTEGDVADTSDKGLQGSEQPEASGQGARASRSASQCCEDGGRFWSVEPSVCGMDDGLPDGLYRGRVATGVKDRVNRLKALGNSVVPQIPELIGRAIMEHEQSKP